MTWSNQHAAGSVAVAIPARNEVAYIAACLRALDDQVGAQVDHIVLCINNTSDETAAVARRVVLRPGTKLHLLEKELSADLSYAGYARRIAMDRAAALAGPEGVVFTTDADAVVDRDWVAQNLAALREGADAVAGWVDLDAADWGRIPMQLHEDDAQECAYDNLCDEIHARLDPDPADPLPRHTQHSGASIAVTTRIYASAGGLPAIKVGEDRAFFAALRNIDARIRHAPECHVTVSGRMVGRAAGGMADTIRRRMSAPDAFLDDRLGPADLCARRADLRRRLRDCVADPRLIAEFAEDVGLEADCVVTLLQTGRFGAAWTAIEQGSEILQRQRVAVADLPEQMARAREICMTLRAEGGLHHPLSDVESAA
jgi:hypothetical protein